MPATEKHPLQNRARRGSGGDWTIARSRALCLYPSLSDPNPLPHSRATPFFSRRTFSISLTRADGIRRNAPRSFPLSAVSPPARLQPFSLSPSRSRFIYRLFSAGSSSFILPLPRLRIVRSLSSREITPSSPPPRVSRAISHALTLSFSPTSPFRVQCTREHPTQSATPTSSVYVPLMQEGNLA